MVYFETYRNKIKKIDIDPNIFLKKSKIEKVFEIADLFFFSLTNIKKKIFLKEDIKSNQINISKFENIFVRSSYKITNKILTLTHTLYVGKRTIKNDTEIISTRKNKFIIDGYNNFMKVKPVTEEKLNYYSAYKGIVETNECDQMAHMNVQFYFEKHSEALKLFSEKIFENKSAFQIDSERCIFHRALAASKKHRNLRFHKWHGKCFSPVLHLLQGLG